MKHKKDKLLVVSVFLCFLLVLSISSVATHASVSVGKWSDPLPTVDGQVSLDDKKRSSHIQISDVNISSQFGAVVGTCDFSLFLAGNGSHVYVGVNISNVPFLANVIFADGGGGNGPQVVSGNGTLVSVRLDNDGNGTIDINEDRKQIVMFNSTFKTASDDYWDGNDFERDVENGPGTGNITDFEITHSDMSAQGNIGNLTVEMVFVNGTDPEFKDGGGIDGDTTTIAVDFMVMGIGSGGIPTMFYAASTAGIGPEEDASGFETITGPIGTLMGELGGFGYYADGTITSTEVGNSEFTYYFLDVILFGPAGWTTDVDVYVANNDTHLYVGVIMDEVPYYANVTWSDPNGPPDEGVPHNITFVTVKFDNDNNDTIDENEDAKEVILGNSTLTVGDDRFWNISEWEHTSDSGSEFPPDPGDMTDFAASHSNPAAQGNIGEFTVELVMLLSDDGNGYDGGGLSSTVGFSVGYQAFVNIVFPIGGGPPESFDAIYFSEFPGMAEEDNNASLFWDLVIKDTNPAPNIDDPDDVTYEEGDTGNSIEWTPTDTNPYKYNITKDGVVVEEGYWDSGEEISIDVDGLSVGNYTYVCTVNDTGGNTASDEVGVSVTEAVSEFSYGYALIVLVTLPLIALIAYRKTRKLKV